MIRRTPVALLMCSRLQRLPPNTQALLLISRRMCSNGSTSSSSQSNSNGGTVDLRSTDLYRRLGLTKGASDDEIRKAYRNLVKQYHPDTATNTDKAKATEDFQHLKDAYETLSNSSSRKFYDMTGSTKETFTARGRTVRINIDRRLLYALGVGCGFAMWYVLRRAKEQTGVSQVYALVWFLVVLMAMPYAPLQAAVIFYYYCRDRARIKELEDAGSLSVVFMPGAARSGLGTFRVCPSADPKLSSIVDGFEIQVTAAPLVVAAGSGPSAASPPTPGPSPPTSASPAVVPPTIVKVDGATTRDIAVPFPPRQVMQYSME